MVALMAVLMFVALAWMPVRGVLQFRASYGPVIFVGHAEGVLGTSYHRLYMWRAPGDESALPAVRIHFDETPHALSEITEDLVQSFGGVVPTGALMDASGYYFHYDFEAGRLRYMALHLSPPPSPEAASRWQVERFQVQMPGGPPFVLPVTREQLRSHAGNPDSRSRLLPN